MSMLSKGQLEVNIEVAEGVSMESVKGLVLNNPTILEQGFRILPGQDVLVAWINTTDQEFNDEAVELGVDAWELADVLQQALDCGETPVYVQAEDDATVRIYLEA